MHKVELRKVMKNVVIDSQQKLIQQAILLDKLLAALTLKKPKCIGLFAALPEEVDLSSLFPISNTIGAYPRVDGETLTFHKVTHLDELSPSKPYGICEPSVTVEIISPDLIIVPGLAFTKEGVRLGRGKGHYDRYISTHKCFTISLAFSWQILPHIPKESHDALIDLVLYC